MTRADWRPPSPSVNLEADWKDSDMLQRMTRRVCRWLGLQNSGQDLLEYALLTSLIAMVAVGAVTQVGSTIQTVFWDAIAAATDAL